MILDKAEIITAAALAFVCAALTSVCLAVASTNPTHEGTPTCLVTAR